MIDKINANRLVEYLNGNISKEEYEYHKLQNFNTITDIIDDSTSKYPKYVKDMLNKAISYSKATSPKNIGSISFMSQEFRETVTDQSFESWQMFIATKIPFKIRQRSYNLAYEMLMNMRQTLINATPQECMEWIKIYINDLINLKTYEGMQKQWKIIQQIAQELQCSYQAFSTPEEESKNIDGYINDKAVSIKPISYKREYNQSIDDNIIMIYYDKKGKLEYDKSLLI